MKLCVIPARGGSKRIPRKNIKFFCGKPLISYSIEAALRSGLFERVIVSTDDDEIAAVAQQYGAEVPFMRPSALADDFTTTLEVVQHAIRAIRLTGFEPDFVACVYATAPLLRADDLRLGFAMLEGHSDKAYALAVTSFPFPVQRAVRISREGVIDAMYPEYRNTRSQDLEPAYHDAGQFCWGRTEAWLRGEVIFSPVTVPVVLPRERVQDIDNPEDWEHAELLFRMLGARMLGAARANDGDEIGERQYRCMPNPLVTIGDYALRAVQPAEIESIRRWRNAQMNVLRQNRHISEVEQQTYYRDQVWPEMSQPQPANILLSLHHHNRHIGYGGLVHIAWAHARAEISFLLDDRLTLDPEVYARHFLAALRLFKRLAFSDLGMNRLFTETWAFREVHMAILEQAGFRREGVCRQHVCIDGLWFDAVFHGILRCDET